MISNRYPSNSVFLYSMLWSRACIYGVTVSLDELFEAHSIEVDALVYSVYKQGPVRQTTSAVGRAGYVPNCSDEAVN